MKALDVKADKKRKQTKNKTSFVIKNKPRPKIINHHKK